MTILLGIVPALMLGFIGGLAAFKRSNNWCQRCGCALRCEHCKQKAVTQFQ